jgi:hypothetical protein
MKRYLVAILMASLIIVASGVAPAPSAPDDTVKPDASVQAVGQPAQPQVGVPTAVLSAGAVTGGQTVADKEAEGKGDQARMALSLADNRFVTVAYVARKPA